LGYSIKPSSWHRKIIESKSEAKKEVKNEAKKEGNPVKGRYYCVTYMSFIGDVNLDLDRKITDWILNRFNIFESMHPNV
jgi:hypothetical protein